MAPLSTLAAINLRLAMIGLPQVDDPDGGMGAALVAPIVARQRELSRRLSDRLCAADQRVQNFLDAYLADCEDDPADLPDLPRRTLVLDEAGLARALSLPIDADEFSSDLLSSYRLRNGVLHNPANDRRTTAGVFHIAEGGLPIPDDKRAVPKSVFAKLLALALDPPSEWMRLPYTANTPHPAHCFVSLLLRPLVQPHVSGFTMEKSMEVRFIAPGGLVSNLDFVETIFGNGGDPYLPDNDAALAPHGWTGHTGAVILAPHLTKVRKKDLGLPSWDAATERQRRDGMAWKDAGELYNGGQAFKVCARDARGVIVTLIADNYFGYCKKEVKTQISYSANLLGNSEEEHSGGAIVFPAYNMGAEFTDSRTPASDTVAGVVERDPQRFELQPDGSALDLTNPDHVIVPGGATFSMRHQLIRWTDEAGEHSIPLRAGAQYFTANGFRVYAKHRELDRTQWHLIGVSPYATQCHKPATVSGGGKSEISKPITDAFVFGNAYAADFDADMDAVAALIERDYSNRFAEDSWNGRDSRPILGFARSFGSVIKLFTPSSDYNDEHNEFLASIPSHVIELLFMVKRYYSPDWGDDWRSHFSVGTVNGRSGNTVRLDGQPVITNMLRVGFLPDGSWRLFSLRPDFSPAIKVQTEDDITASTVAPGPDGSTKYVANCEGYLFQRPDDAIHRGYDKQTERDMSRPDTFISNFQPLSAADAREMIADVQAFSEFTDPMADLILAAADQADDSPRYFVCSANPRLVDGKPSKNPRYLQLRPDLANPEATAAADLASRLALGTPAGKRAALPVHVVVAARRNNAKEEGVPPLCAYNPLHYMELPELFMEFISSMTGKSPSTTGAGSEGAMTKGPFNALPTVYDLNAAFLSYALTGDDGWLSSAGFVGPHVRVDHDISLLVPEVFCRMTPAERRADALIAAGCMERLTDFEYDGKPVLASRLGYRMNRRFATLYFGRIFMHPDVVFTQEMLRPELQDEAMFAESVATIVATHQRVAQAFFDDGTVELAVPPIRGLLEIMATGVTAQGHDLDSPEFRELFTRESVLASDWYFARLDAKRAEDVRRAKAAVDTMSGFYRKDGNEAAIERIGMADRLEQGMASLRRYRSDAYRASLIGTLGRQVYFGD